LAAAPRNSDAWRFLKNKCKMLKMTHDGCCKNDVIWIQMVNGKRVLRAKTADECRYNVNICFSVPLGTVLDADTLHLD